MMTSRSRGSNRRFAGAALLLAWLACCACGGGPVGPTDSNFLDGRVVDAEGHPVAGAAVSLVYTLESNVAPVLARQASTTVPMRETSDLRGMLLRYEVLDYMRRSVRVLFDRSRGDSLQPRSWNGEDDDGNPVPNGVYYLRLHSRNEDGTEFFGEGKLVMFVETMDELLRRKHAVTDASGSYRIPMGLLPIGEELTLADEEGYTWKDRISPRVQVYALRRVGSDIRFVRNEIVVEDRFASRRVDLTLP